MQRVESLPKLYRDLMKTYESCIKSKPGVKRSAFHLDYEAHIDTLAREILARRYHPGRSNIFVVFHPKPREIIAAHIRDRIVHHYIYEYMAPYWEPRFSDRSFACRPERGPLFAVKELRRFINSYQRHSMKPLYYLKVDIASFFPSIDLHILRKLIFRKLTHPLISYLVDVTLKHRPVAKGNFVLNSPKSAWQKIPKYKSMFYAPSHKGLPIGNLTSQFFANIYLNEIDQFITHQLKPRGLYWQRYVDDILFLSDRADDLKAIPMQLGRFLSEQLALKLNPKKTILQPLARGLDHLGYWLKPDHMLIRQKNVKTCLTHFDHIDEKTPEAMRATFNSYLGHFRQGHSQRLRQKIGQTLEHKKVAEGRLTMDERCEKVLLKKDQKVASMLAEREQAMVAEFQSFYQSSAHDRGIYLQNWRSLAGLLQEADAMLGGEN